MNHSKVSQEGNLLCARYAFMPNKLRYCGGDNNSELYEYASRLYVDPGLTGLLEEFETLYPYLKLIAAENKITDPFDKRVVEAYWIGNDLLRGISMKDFYNHLSDTLRLKDKLTPKMFEKVVGVIPKGALPHHNFHVIAIPKRTGSYPVEHTIETMDKCRIGYGKILKINDNKLEVKSCPLEMNNDLIVLGRPIARDYIWQLNSKGFIKDLKKGDWVSLHWDFACDKLTESQVKQLQYYTQLSINLVNSKISK